MSNELIHRMVDFLKTWPPFSFLKTEDLYALLQSAKVKFVPYQETIFQISESPPSHFYVVYKGHVRLMDEENHLINTCDDGDLFGLRALMAASSYLLNATAAEDTLLYCIPFDKFKDIIKNDSKANSFLATLFATNFANHKSESKSKELINITDAKSILESQLNEVLLVNFSKKVITCQKTDLIKDAAKIMASNKIGSILIADDHNRPLGIVTDKDFRNRVVTGEVHIDLPIESIMSSPVLCINQGLTLAELQMILVREKINHLVVTSDGTDKSSILGVISHHDIMLKLASSPIRLYKEINKVRTIAELVPLSKQVDDLLTHYLQREVAITFIADMVTMMNEAMTQKCIQLASQTLEIDTSILSKICWLQLGSAGRKEQLIKTDQDNAIVYENNLSHEEISSINRLAALTNDYLNEIGFEYCPAEVMARNPNNCLSLNEFVDRFLKWISIPDEKAVLNAGIYFDFLPIFGNMNLPQLLRDEIDAALSKDKLLLRMMLKENLNSPPPLSFFKNFVVERNGEHKEQFDLKARAIAPLVDLARILSLEYGLGQHTNTLDRYNQLAELEPQHKSLFELAADAFEILLKFKAIAGINGKNSGRYLNLNELPKMDKLILRNSFGPIHDLQEMLSVRYQLNTLL